jgi:hypothetical protein
VLADNQSQRVEWLNAYIETYVQRDVRALSNIQNLSQFSRFVNLIAGRTAQVVNYSELGKDIGVNYKTAQHYLSLLEASYLWRSIPAYYQAGSEKRLIKSPKGVFLDTGLAMYLIGLDQSGIERNPLYGAMFESFVTVEFLKLIAAFGKHVNISYFRLAKGSEVDLVLHYRGKIIPIEMKCSASPDPSWGKGIADFRSVAGLNEDAAGYVVSLYPEPITLGQGLVNVPLGMLL